jgi:hypothetical protein
VGTRALKQQLNKEPTMNEETASENSGFRFGDEFLLEDYRQKNETFRMYTGARLTIVRFFYLSFTATSGLIGYLALKCRDVPIFTDNKDVLIGVISFVGSLIGAMLILANVGLSFEIAEHARGIWHYQKFHPITKDYLKQVEENSHRWWSNSNFPQICCMMFITPLYGAYGLYLLHKICFLFVIAFIVAIAVLIFGLCYYLKKKEFSKRRARVLHSSTV